MIVGTCIKCGNKASGCHCANPYFTNGMENKTMTNKPESTEAQGCGMAIKQDDVYAAMAAYNHVLPPRFKCKACDGEGREQDDTPCSNPNYRADCKECDGHGYREWQVTQAQRMEAALMVFSHNTRAVSALFERAMVLLKKVDLLIESNEFCSDEAIQAALVTIETEAKDILREKEGR